MVLLLEPLGREVVAWQVLLARELEVELEYREWEGVVSRVVVELGVRV